MSKFIINRLRHKLANMGVIVIPALVVSLVLGGLLYFLAPLLPLAWRDGLALLRTAATSANPAELRDFIGSFGLNAQVVFFGLQLLQVLLAPIPGHLTGFLGGYLFGFWQGLALSMAAMTLGSAVLMLAGRLVGERIARRFVSAEIMARFDQRTMEEDGVMSFFMIFLLPAFPDDAICFIAGMTRLSIAKLMLASTIGRIPGVAVLTYTGASLNESFVWGQIVFGVAIVAALLVWFFEEEVLALIKKL
ncbi:MAG: VTT domain-containing protein [Caldilineaceae bacterium]